MEAILKAVPRNGKLVFNNFYDYDDYLKENDGIPLIINISHESKYSQKQKMFAYFFGPVLDSSVRGFNQIGYSGIDKVSARYKLQAEFAKGELYNDKTGETEIYLLDLAKMPKERLLLFIQQCLHFLEEHLGQRVPDSETYKMMKLTGRNLTSTKKRL